MTFCRRCGERVALRVRLCDACRRPRRKSVERRVGRASAADRGYGGEHQRLRARLARLVEAGGVACWRCGGLIAAGEPWDLGHDDVDRGVYRGPEHRACNRATSGRQGSPSRRW